MWLHREWMVVPSRCRVSVCLHILFWFIANVISDMEQELPMYHHHALYIPPLPYDQFCPLLHFGYFCIVEGKDVDTNLMENEFTISIYTQPHFQQRSEKLILHIYICQDQSWKYSTLCFDATNLPWSICGWELWIYQMRNCTANSTSSNKKPFRFLIYLGPALWLCSRNDLPAQVEGCANDFRLQEKFLLPRALIYPAVLLIGTSGLLWPNDMITSLGICWHKGWWFVQLTPSICLHQLGDILPKDCPNHRTVWVFFLSSAMYAFSNLGTHGYDERRALTAHLSVGSAHEQVLGRNY